RRVGSPPPAPAPTAIADSPRAPSILRSHPLERTRAPQCAARASPPPIASPRFRPLLHPTASPLSILWISRSPPVPPPRGPNPAAHRTAAARSRHTPFGGLAMRRSAPQPRPFVPRHKRDFPPPPAASLLSNSPRRKDSSCLCGCAPP